MAGQDRSSDELAEKILQVILRFPQRIDVMETRSEENSRALARELVQLFEEEASKRRDS